MNYSVTVAAILASATYWRGRTEFDKAAEFHPGNALKLSVLVLVSYLVTSHTILFHLLKLALKLRLSLHLLLGTADIDELAIELLPIHLIHCLQKPRGECQLCGQ